MIIIIILIIIIIIIIIIIVTITMWEFFIQMAYITQGGFAEKVVEKNVRSILGFQFIKIYFKKLLFRHLFLGVLCYNRPSCPLNFCENIENWKKNSFFYLKVKDRFLF